MWQPKPGNIFYLCNSDCHDQNSHGKFGVFLITASHVETVLRGNCNDDR